MKLDEFFISSCAAMEVDTVKYADDVTVCRYPDGWAIMFTNCIHHDNPAKMDLGRWCKDEESLRGCLKGFWQLGKVIRPEEAFWK